jgi:hypothetical protein
MASLLLLNMRLLRVECLDQQDVDIQTVKKATGARGNASASSGEFAFIVDHI